MAVRIMMLMFWVLVSCRFVGRWPKDGESMFLQNAGSYP
jgi:hypothetical protein